MRYGVRRHKFGVADASERLYNGVLYASKLEKSHAVLLDSLMSARNPKDRVIEWRRQVRLPIIVGGVLICHYVCDFEVRYADGREELHEAKGADTPMGTLKMKLFRAIYPDKVLKVVR